VNCATNNVPGRLGGARDRARISATNEALDQDSPTNADQIRLQASLIGAKDCVILPQLAASLGLRQNGISKDGRGEANTLK
jgi:hypothetical protein